MKTSVSLEWGEEIKGGVSQRQPDERKIMQKLFSDSFAK